MSTLKVDAIQTAAGATPSLADLGIDGGIVQMKHAIKTNTQSLDYNSGRTVISGLNLTFDAEPTTGNKILLLGSISIGFASGDPGSAVRWEYSTDNSSWSSRDRNDYYSGGAHAGADANSNFAAAGASYMNNLNNGNIFGAYLLHAVDVSDVNNAEYYRITIRQTDNSNNTIYINRSNIVTGDGFTGSAISTFIIMEVSV